MKNKPKMTTFHESPADIDEKNLKKEQEREDNRKFLEYLRQEEECRRQLRKKRDEHMDAMITRATIDGVIHDLRKHIQQIDPAGIISYEARMAEEAVLRANDPTWKRSKPPGDFWKRFDNRLNDLLLYRLICSYYNISPIEAK